MSGLQVAYTSDVVRENVGSLGVVAHQQSGSGWNPQRFLMGLSSVGAIPASSFMGDKNSYWRPTLNKTDGYNSIDNNPLSLSENWKFLGITGFYVWGFMGT